VLTCAHYWNFFYVSFQFIGKWHIPALLEFYKIDVLDKNLSGAWKNRRNLNPTKVVAVLPRFAR
jgi:hypothetical protein